jgi:hypothetical protein
MRSIRSCFVAALIASVLLSGVGVATAQNTYPLIGKIVSTRGTFIRIPILGNSFDNCTGVMRGHRTGMLMSPTMTYTNLINQQPAAPFGCVSIDAVINTPVQLLAPGVTFSVPTSAISKPLPADTVAVSVPLEPQIIQLATSFRVFGPPTARPMTGEDAPGHQVMDLMAPFPMTATLGPTMLMTAGGTPTNLAPLRRFEKNAHADQTGRAGATFTWCYNYGACTNVAQGQNMIVKVKNPKANKFGGTMSYLLQTGPNPSSLAVGAPPSGPVALLGLAGMGDQPTGRGYADLLTDKIMTGPAFLLHMEGMVTPPQFGGQMFTLITMVTGLTMIAPGTQVAATNKNIGFPWTTGTAIVMQTGSTGGQPMTLTFTGMGSDNSSVLPGRRNISLIAPQVARTNIAGGTNTAGMGFMTLTLPEPGGVAQLLVGALALAAMAAWRSRHA